jgi:hypothetical protein
VVRVLHTPNTQLVFFLPGYFLLAVIYGCIVYFSDWQKYSDLAMKRAEVKSKAAVINE